MMNRQDAMAHAFRFLHKSETRGDYFEFGVFQGRSLVAAYKVHSQLETETRHLYAFDSFSGLPAFEQKDKMSDYHVFHEGQFAVSEADVVHNLRNNGLPDEATTLIAGYYEESLLRSKNSLCGRECQGRPRAY